MGLVVLPSGSRLYWARATDDFHDSALLHLVSGIYALDAGNARTLLRPHFFQTTPLTARDYGLMKVAAKRGSHDPAQVAAWMARTDLEKFDLSGALEDLPSAEFCTAMAVQNPPLSLPEGANSEGTLLPGTPPRGTPPSAMALAQALADSVPPAEKHHARDRPVGCVITDAADQILAAERNRGAGNRILHAELLAVLRYCRSTGRRLPRGARVFTTLKPCRMCAGFIWDCAEDPRSLRVEFLEFDPGRNARVTILDEGSPERDRFG